MESKKNKPENTLGADLKSFHTVLQSIGDAVIITDKRGYIQYVNSSAEWLTGWHKSKAIGKPFEDVFNILNEQTREKVENPIKKVLEEGITVGLSKHTLLITKDSREIPVVESFTPIKDDRGEIIGMALVFRPQTAHLQFAREKERAMIAREIHDELGQQLTALRIDLAWLGKHLPKQNKALKEKKDIMVHQVEGLMKAIKDLSSKLRPGFLDELGLVGALELYVEEFEEKTGITCGLTVKAEDLKLDWERSIALFRICQEALTNVSRHSSATGVKVRLEEKKKKVVLSLQDNGKGISEKQKMASDSYGIIGMKERVDYFGGHILILGTRNRGTIIRVEIPFPGVPEKR